MQSTYLLLYNYVIDVKSGQVFAECLQSLSSIGIYELNPFDLLINYCFTCTANVVCRHYVFASPWLKCIVRIYLYTSTVQ